MTAGEATREFYREQGRKQEQERILEILAKQWLPIADQEAAVALIKGEK
jgi:hypothetical protein